MEPTELIPTSEGCRKRDYTCHYLKSRGNAEKNKDLK
jgi:hypothetical protein